MVRRIAWLSLLTACAGSGPGLPTRPPQPTAPTAPPIGEALDCGTISPVGGIAEGTGLLRHDLDPARFPNAICNDGSPGVFYLRTAEDPEYHDDWLIHLQGGATCSDGPSCADRWCHRNQGFGMNKMSSTVAPEVGIRGGGLLSRDRRNPFAGWNLAFLYYCSSDAWLGRSMDHVLSGARSDGTQADYTIAFHGADILDAVLEVLRQPDGAALPGEEAPDLDQAQRIVFSGSSVGGTGAIHHLDRIAATLPNAEVVGLIDAIYTPSATDPEYASSTPCLSGTGPCSHQERYTHDWQILHRDLLDADGETSCLGHHPDDPWACAESNHLLEHHLTTPFFARMDQADGLFMPLFEGVRLMSPTTFGQRVADQIGALPALPDTAEEGAAMSRAPGGFSPICGDHDATTDTPAMFEVYVQPDTPHDTPVHTADVLVGWMDSRDPQLVTSHGDDLSCP